MDMHRSRLLWLLALLLTVGCSQVRVQAAPRTLEEVRIIYPSEWGVPYPAGLSYSLDREQLALLAKRGHAQSLPDSSSIVVITPYEDLVGTANLPFIADNAINLAYDDARDQLLLLNNQQAELVRVVVGEDGVPDPDGLARFHIAHLGLKNADGMGVDPSGGRLFVLDSATTEVVCIKLDGGLDLISKLDLSYLGAAKLRGLAVHPLSSNLFVVSPVEELMYELSQSGQLITTYDLAGLDLVDPQGLAFGPSADLTDAPDTIHLFIADSNLPDVKPVNAGLQPGDNKSGAPQLVQSPGAAAGKDKVERIPTAQVFGRILEVALAPAPAGAAQRSRTIDYSCHLS
jgi:hypothetical protein